jgi:excisionase family DNA binding protein
MQEPERLTVRDIALELDCAEDDVRALIREGELRTVACGIRPGLVPRHELDAYRRRVLHGAAGPPTQPLP